MIWILLAHLFNSVFMAKNNNIFSCVSNCEELEYMRLMGATVTETIRMLPIVSDEYCEAIGMHAELSWFYLRILAKNMNFELTMIWLCASINWCTPPNFLKSFNHKRDKQDCHQQHTKDTKTKQSKTNRAKIVRGKIAMERPNRTPHITKMWIVIDFTRTIWTRPWVSPPNSELICCKYTIAMWSMCEYNFRIRKKKSDFAAAMQKHT